MKWLARLGWNSRAAADDSPEVRHLKTRLVAEEIKTARAETALYDLQVAMFVWGRRTGNLTRVLEVVDGWRERSRRDKLGLLREMLESGDAVPTDVDGEPRIALSHNGARRANVANLRGLLAFAFVMVAASNTCAESLAVSAMFHLTPQAADYFSTTSCRSASNAVATCDDGNAHVRSGLAVKKVTLGLALTAGDRIIGKRSATGKWIYRVVSVVGLGVLPYVHNRQNEAAVRAAGQR